jgi:hypothetical protein
MIIPDFTSYRTFMGPNRTPGPCKVGADDDPSETFLHVANFIKAVRSRQSSDLTAGPEELHLSASLTHFANIAYRTGRMLHFDPKTDRFVGDEQANRMLTQTYRSPYVMPQSI